jgi:hypothetical protein
MFPIYQGQTRVLTTNASVSCILGGYAVYAINVTDLAQIELAINFARASNIRLVIKNTGHDFSGKYGRAGSLSIWKHHLKILSLYRTMQTIYWAIRTRLSGWAPEFFIVRLILQHMQMA